MSHILCWSSQVTDQQLVFKDQHCPLGGPGRAKNSPVSQLVQGASHSDAIVPVAWCKLRDQQSTRASQGCLDKLKQKLEKISKTAEICKATKSRLLGSWIRFAASMKVRMSLHLEAKAIRLGKPPLITFVLISRVWHITWSHWSIRVLFSIRVSTTRIVHPCPAAVLADNRSQVPPFSEKSFADRSHVI